ncbi:MAG: thiamine pyrophosphate-binding protein, partial [Microvirga sp.]
GGHLESLYRGCAEYGIQIVDFRHEASAGHAAEAHARATGELGVCVVTAGPGYLNAITPMINAQLDGVPTLFIIGAPPLREAECNSLQGGFDQIAMAAPALKWAHRVTHPERIPDLLAMAMRKATSGRSGAVLLELPIDVLHTPVRIDLVTSPNIASARARSAPLASDIAATISLLQNAQRPAIVCGSEARFAACEEALRAFVDRAGIPVFCNSRAFGMLPGDHKLYGHEPNNLATLQADGVPPDVVLLLGAKAGMFLGGRKTTVLPADAKIIQVLHDPTEIGRIRHIDVGIAADCNLVLMELLAASEEEPWPDWRAWGEKAAAAKNDLLRRFPQERLEHGLHPFFVARTVVDVFGPDATYVVDGGEAALWSDNAVRVNGPGQVMRTGYLGALGAGMGMAIGAKLAKPHRPLVQMVGDGSIGFHLQELETMVRWQLPIVTVVFNNAVWGMSLHGQQLLFGEHYSAISKLSPDTSYARIAEGFGCLADTVVEPEELVPALKRAIQSGRPALLDVRTDPTCVHPKMTATFSNATPDHIVIPYYESFPVH